MGPASASQDEGAAFIAAAKAADEAAFGALVERHHCELQVHCYRILGSFEDSEDLVQETSLRAWRNRASFQGSANAQSSLMALDMIDEYRLMVNPVVLGAGIPLFKGLKHNLQLKLADSRTFRSGNILLSYQPA